MRDRYRRGEILVTVPRLLFLEIINVAGRRWSWSEDRLTDLAVSLEELDFAIGRPDLAGVAAWTARGLTAYGSNDLRQIAGAKSHEIAERLGYTYGDEAVHRNNLVVLAN